MRNILYLILLTALWGCAALPSSTQNIDRIIQSIGVDAFHSDGEEARTRQGVLMAIDELAKHGASQIPPRAGPQFEAIVRQNMEANQRVRRDSRVTEAYRSTLAKMLTSEELATAAAFYESPAGRKAHIAVIEAEKVAGAAMERIAEQASK